ncbi:MAG: hypothetical protein GX442_12865 [Candidatus Riflebacteria bacterium]|nr:hypothetical protein [Candidatus Riflebacteria bacterium]
MEGSDRHEVGHTPLPPRMAARNARSAHREGAVRRGFGLVEALVAVMLFTIICLPLYRLYFETVLGQQRMIRDFLAISNVSEKILNRVDHQVERLKRPLKPAAKEVTAQILIGLEERGDWAFLGQSFADESGAKAVKYIPVLKSDVAFKTFKLEASAIPSDQRNNNPKLLQEVLDTINRRAGMMTVETQWSDTDQMKHGFQMQYIRALEPEY